MTVFVKRQGIEMEYITECRNLQVQVDTKSISLLLDHEHGNPYHRECAPCDRTSPITHESLYDFGEASWSMPGFQGHSVLFKLGTIVKEVLDYEGGAANDSTHM